MSVYKITYQTLYHTYPGISTAADIGKYSPSTICMELERDLSLTLSSINPEISLETHKIFHPEKPLRKQYMVTWYRHSFTFTNVVEGMVAYISSTLLLN